MFYEVSIQTDLKSSCTLNITWSGPNENLQIWNVSVS